VLSLTGTGSIPAAVAGVSGTCNITATVTSSTPNAYTVTLPQGFFTTGDGSNPPGGAGGLSATLSVTAPQAVTISLVTSRGTATTDGANVLNSLFTNVASDLTPAYYTRSRYRFTNPNPFPLTNVGLNFPYFGTRLNIIPNSFISGSAVTDNSAGLPVGGVAGCGGTLTVTPYTVNPPTATPLFAGSAPQPASPATLAGATIPANGTCEVSFLMRYDVTGTDAGLVLGGGTGGTTTTTISFPVGLLTSAEGVSNSAAAPTQNGSNSLQMVNPYVSGAPTSGYAGESTTIQLGLSSSNNAVPLTPVSPGLLWSVDDGITPQIPPAGIAGTGVCSGTLLTWDSVNRRIALNGTTPAGANCYFSVQFTSSYTGANAYADASVCSMPQGIDGVRGNADDAYVTLPSNSIKLKVTGRASNASLNADNCVTYRAVKASGPDANAVKIDARLLDYAGNPITQFPSGGDALVQLTLTASSAVTSYHLQTSAMDTAVINNNIRNADPALAYVPTATSSNCGPNATVTATPNDTSFSVSGIDIGAGASCTVTVPVVFSSATPRIVIRTCDAAGIIGASEVCSEGVSPTLTVSSVTGTYFSYTSQFIPAVADQATALAQGTIYRFTLNKNAGMPPVESFNASSNATPSPMAINLAYVSGVNYGLQATSVVTNTCNATIGGLGTGTLTINAGSTPDAQAQGKSYSAPAGKYDEAAFAASSCVIEVKVMPQTNAPLGGHTANGYTNSYVYTNNGANTGMGARQNPNTLTYTLVANPEPITISKSFAPSALSAGQSSVMTVELNNAAGTNVDLTGASVFDAYPPGLINAILGPLTIATTTGAPCTGTATAGAGSLNLTNATIPAGSICRIQANVQTTSAAGVTNTIAANSFVSDQGITNTGAASASLTMNQSIGPVLQFTPASVNFDPNGTTATTLNVAIVNSFGSVANNVTLSLSLPAGLSIIGTVTIPASNPPGCVLYPAGAGIVTSTIPASSTCMVEVPVRVEAAGIYDVTAVPNALTATVNGNPETNSSTVTATLTAAPAATVTVTKTVTGGTAAATGYTVTLTCGSGTFAVPVAVGTPGSQSVVAGDSCTSSETARPTAPSGYAWGTETITGGSFTTVAGAPVSVSVTNPLTPLAQPVNITSVFSPAMGGTPPAAALNCGAATVGGTYPNLTAPTGSSCTVSASGGTPPAGYTAGATTFAVTGASSGTTSFTVGAGTTTVTATTPLTGTTQTVTVTTAFSGGTGGTPPTATLTCTPAAGGAYPTYTASTGSNCTLTGVNGTAPAGYTLGAFTYGGPSMTAGGVFTMPAGGGTVTVTQALVSNTLRNVTLPTGADNVFSPSTVTGGALPAFAMTCSAAPTGTPPNLQAPEGATCTVTVSTGATAPAGYELQDAASAAAMLGTVVNGTGVTRSATGFAFTVPNTALALSASTLLRGLDQPVTVSGVTFDSTTIAVTTPPTITLDCGAATVSGAYPDYEVATGSVCTARISGGVAPAGYTFGDETFGGTGVDPATGAFTVAAGGLPDLSVKITLQPVAAGTTAIPTLDARALALLALLLAAVAAVTRRGRR